VLGAAVFEMRFRDFGRGNRSREVLVRFLTLALLTLWFGPQIVELTATVVRQHFGWLLGAIAGGVLVWLLMRRSKKRKGQSS